MNIKKDAAVRADGGDLALATAEGNSLVTTLGLFVGGNLLGTGERRCYLPPHLMLCASFLQNQTSELWLGYSMVSYSDAMCHAGKGNTDPLL